MNDLNQELLKQWTDSGHKISDFSDEYHSFNDLYIQRMYLTALAFNSNPGISWKSKKHEDGTMFEGYFIVGINTPKGQYTYHYKLEHWDLFSIPELPKSPTYDGHTSADVARLSSVVPNLNTFSVYALEKDSNLLIHLDGGVQEEHLLPMEEVLEELKGTDEFDQFIEEVDTSAANCLLIKGW